MLDVSQPGRGARHEVGGHAAQSPRHAGETVLRSQGTYEGTTRTAGLESSPLILGRGDPLGGDGPVIDLSPDFKVSRRHVRLVADATGRWSVEDLGRVNGTRIDGRRLPPDLQVPLLPGMRLQLGDTELQVLE